MNILYMNLDSYCDVDMLDMFEELKKEGEDINVTVRKFKNTPERSDEIFEKELYALIKELKPDVIFSFNYYPLISKSVQSAFEESGALYISWVYDSPLVSLFSCTLINECNRVFLFDYSLYEFLEGQGINTVFYLPLAVNVKRLDSMEISADIWHKYQARISFVGGLYTESHTFYDRMEKSLDPYTKGYLEGLMNAQLKVSGINFIEKSLNKRVVADMYAAYPVDANPDGVETTEWLYSEYFINRKITQIERSEYLRSIGLKNPVSLYTRDNNFAAEGVKVYPPVDYYDMTPYVFKCSDINLNISLRSIHTGIPLRVFDIMGCGGFVLTNYQEDMLRHFVPDRHFVYFEDKKDMLEKIDFYLSHDREREEIARNGYEECLNNHTFRHRWRQILDVVEK